MSRRILHLDMDAFFAAVEQLDFPQYRGKPVIVGADPKGGAGRGVVATASYEARKYGVHSALPISLAYQRCPHAVYLRGRYERYSEISRQLIATLNEFTPVIEKISIDEAFLDITKSLALFGSAEKIGHQIKKRIYDDLGLVASIGIAPNKFLAKVASDLEKPDGFVVVKEGEEKEFLKSLPISRLWGVGKKTEAALKQMDIETIGQIAHMPEQDLSRRFGKWGSALWRLANGIDPRSVKPWETQKSISQETTFDEDTGDEEAIHKTLLGLAESLSRLMRKSKLKGRTVTLKIRLEDFSTFTRSKTLSDFVDSTQILKGVAIGLYKKFNKKNMKVRLLGIGVSQLNSVSGEQLGLFEQEAPLDAKMTKLLDSLQDKYGEGAVKRASLLDKTKPQFKGPH
ncbi:DNA polymerase IV [candidate division KSB1 bacterium]|nr:DNA polymerase IV [candidate division KSB1 bacterium]